MRPTDTFGLALQNLRRTRLRTTLSALGVAIGTAAVVALISAGQGFQSIAVARASTFGSLTGITVAAESDGGRPLPIRPATVQSLAAIPHVANIATVLQMPPLRLQVGAHALDLPTRAQSPITQGPFLAGTAPASADGIVIPGSVARSLGETPGALVGRAVTLTAGGTVCCTTTRDSLTLIGPDRTFPAQIAGVYNDGNSQVGSSAMLTSTELGATIVGSFSGSTASQYIDHQGYSTVLVQADDARQTATVAAAIKRQGYRVSDRADLLAQVHLVFNIITAGLAAIGSIALLVAAIGIANTMIMTVLERTREIGIMKALGAEPGSIRWLFLFESAMVGILGGVVGIFLAVGATLIGNAGFAKFVQSQDPGNAIANLFIVSPVLVAAGMAMAIGISLVGGAIPSRRAVRLQPLDALRYE